MPPRPIECPEVIVSCEELDTIEAFEPVDYVHEPTGDATISKAIRRARRKAKVGRLAVIGLAIAVAVGLSHPTTLQAIGVVTSR
jgi:hypothetical protein